MSYEIVKIIGAGVIPLRTAVIPRVEDALHYAHGEITAQALLDQVAQCQAQLWLVYRVLDRSLCAVAVTEVRSYSELSSLLVVALSGTGIDSWARALHDAFEGYCKEQHLQRMEAVGRKGFERKLGPLGFNPMYTVFVKEVNYEQISRDN